MNLTRRGLNEQDINDKEQTLINNLKIYLQDLIESETKENDLLQSRIRAILDECIHLNRLLKLDYSIQVRLNLFFSYLNNFIYIYRKLKMKNYHYLNN